MARRLTSVLKKTTYKAAGGFTGLDELSAALAAIGQDLQKIDNAIVAVDRKIAPHAHWVEYGTMHSKSVPFFRVSINFKKRDVSRYIGSQIGKLIDGTRANGQDIMLEAANIYRDQMRQLAPVGMHKPHKLGEKHVISPGDLRRGIVTRKYARTTASGMFISDTLADRGAMRKSA